MERSELIGSGIFEAYILGLCSTEERLEVESILEKMPDLRNEMEEIEAVLELLAMRFAVVPRSSDKVKRQAEDQIFTSKKESSEPIVRPMETAPARSPINVWKLLSIAASILLILSFGYVNRMQNRLRESEEQVLISRAESLHIQEDIRKLTSSQEQLSKLTRSIGEEGTRQVILTSTNQQPAKAIVFWNPANHKVWLVNTNLPELPSGKQYQLWGIVDGKPVDAGVFDANPGQTMIAIELKEIAQPQAMAVTIENKGGAASPTLSTLCLKADI